MSGLIERDGPSTQSELGLMRGLETHRTEVSQVSKSDGNWVPRIEKKVIRALHLHLQTSIKHHKNVCLSNVQRFTASRT